MVVLYKVQSNSAVRPHFLIPIAITATVPQTIAARSTLLLFNAAFFKAPGVLGVAP